MGIDDHENFTRAPDYPEQGRVSFQIDHTDRTWGADIEALLTKHFSNILLPVSQFQHFCRRNAGLIGFFTASVFYTVLAFAAFVVIQTIVTQYATQYSDISSAADALGWEVTIRKLDFISNVIVYGLWAKIAALTLIYMIIGLIFASVVGVISSQILSFRRDSYIRFTKQDDLGAIMVGWLSQHSVFIAFISHVGMVLAGLLGNIIFFFMVRWLTAAT